MTATKQAMSHAGMHDGFEIFWAERGEWLDYFKDSDGRAGKGHPNPEGWYIGIPDCEGTAFGPYETSQAAFGDAKCAIDTALEEGTRYERAFGDGSDIG